MNLEKTFDRIHSKVIKNWFLQLFTAFTRILLAIGFIPPSIPKIMYERFTFLPETDPVGHYFEALYQTGFYYQFIGWGQIIAAILLLIPKTSHIGALMFLPIIINITVLTNSVGFKGTWLITIFMSIASIYLVCWDYDKWKSIVFFTSEQKSTLVRNELLVLPIISAVGVICAFLLMTLMVFQNFSNIKIQFIIILGSIGLMFGFAIALHHKFMWVGNVETLEK